MNYRQYKKIRKEMDKLVMDKGFGGDSYGFFLKDANRWGRLYCIMSRSKRVKKYKEKRKREKELSGVSFKILNEEEKTSFRGLENFFVAEVE